MTFPSTTAYLPLNAKEQIAEAVYTPIPFNKIISLKLSGNLPSKFTQIYLEVKCRLRALE